MSLSTHTTPRRPGGDPAWSRRQREVLGLLVRGRTNGQIAAELGISLDGAKWHVSEIITKLGVDSREDAAEYWRAHNGLRLRFTRALRALVPTAAWTKVAAAGATLAVAAVGGVMVVLALQQAGDGDVARPTPVAAETKDAATPVPSQTPANQPPSGEAVAGVPVKPLTLAADATLPSDLVLYYGVMGYATDGGANVLTRVFRDSAGQLQRDDLFAPIRDGHGVYTWIADFQRQEIVAAICTVGYCGGIAAASDDAQNHVYRSTDGGITWSDYGKLPRDSFLAAFSDEGPVMTTAVKTGDAYSLGYAYLSGQALLPPVAGTEPTQIGHEMLWLDAATGQYFDSHGTAVSWRNSVPSPATPQLIDSSPGQHFIAWSGSVNKPYDQQPYKNYLGVTDDAGALQQIVSVAGNRDVRAVAAISPALLIGNAGVDASGELAIGMPTHYQAAVIDLSTQQIHALPEVSAGLGGWGAGKNEHAFVFGARTGAFVRVNTGGDCLNVRATAATNATSLGCFNDGVLLGRRTGPDAVSGGVTWSAVSTPAGQAGWASAEYLK